MNVAIVGSRSLEGRRKEVIEEITESPWLPPVDEGPRVNKIVSGGADGVDTYAKVIARTHDIELREIEPEWEKYGPAAGPKRNTKIIEAADAVIAIWDGQSSGTEDSIEKALSMGKDLYVKQLE